MKGLLGVIHHLRDRVGIDPWDFQEADDTWMGRFMNKFAIGMYECLQATYQVFGSHPGDQPIMALRSEYYGRAERKRPAVIMREARRRRGELAGEGGELMYTCSSSEDEEEMYLTGPEHAFHLLKLLAGGLVGELQGVSLDPDQWSASTEEEIRQRWEISVENRAADKLCQFSLSEINGDRADEDIAGAWERISRMARAAAGAAETARQELFSSDSEEEPPIRQHEDGGHSNQTKDSYSSNKSKDGPRHSRSKEGWRPGDQTRLYRLGMTMHRTDPGWSVPGREGTVFWQQPQLPVAPRPDLRHYDEFVRTLLPGQGG